LHILFTNMDYIAAAKALIETDIAGLRQLQDQLDDSFAAALELMDARLSLGNRIIITGVGKSHDIGCKIAATFNSTGTPAFALHASEAIHGGLGMIRDGDVVLAISYSGVTLELLNMLPFAKRAGAHIVAITGSPQSDTAALADFVIPIKVAKEACPFNLAPTTSSLVTLAVGDAIAMLLSQRRGFSREDFAKLHPSGAIGHSLLKVTDLMRKGKQVARVHRDDTVKQAVNAITDCHAGAVAVVDDDGKVIGIVTDGDCRRFMARTDHYTGELVADIMTENPIVLTQDHLAVEAMGIFEKHTINTLIITDANDVFVGMVDIQDMPKMKLM
jgi:arabinose-5-phosphate isomerase